MDQPYRQREEPPVFFLGPWNDRPGGPSPRGELPGFELLMLSTCLLGFLILAIMVGLGVAHTLDVRARDVEADAQVIDRRSQMHTTSKGRVSGHSYYVRYRFEHPDGQLETESEVGRIVHDAAETGTLMHIRYEAADPTNVGSASESTAYDPPWALFFWLVFSAGAARMFWRLMREDAWFYLRGRLVRGRLVAVDTRPDARGDPWIHVRYSFSSPTTGATIEGERRIPGKSWSTAIARRTPDPGDPVLVRHAGDDIHELL